MEERNFTPSALNAFQKDAADKAKNTKWGYPCVIIPTDGKGSGPCVSMLGLKEVGNPVTYDFDLQDSKRYLTFKGQTQVYEFTVPETGEVKKIKIPLMPNLPLPELLKTAAGIFTFTEALRKFINMSVMTRREIINLGIQSSGIILGDKLLGIPGINMFVEENLRKIYDSEKNTVSINTFLSEHENAKVVTELKDKTVAAVLEQASQACEKIAEGLEKSVGGVSVLNIGSTQTVPTVVAEPNINVAPISSINEKNNSKATIIETI